MLYFKCRLEDIKPYTIGRCRDLKPATMPTLVIRSAYFFICIIRQQLSNKTFSQQYVMVQRFIKIFFLIMNIRCIQNHLQRISILYQQQNLIWKRGEIEFVDFLYKNLQKTPILKTRTGIYNINQFNLFKIYTSGQGTFAFGSLKALTQPFQPQLINYLRLIIDLS